MNPSMKIKHNILLAEFPVNGTYIIGIYQGSLSKYDILIKYRKLEELRLIRLELDKSRKAFCI